MRGITEILEDLTPQSRVSGLVVDGYYQEASGFINFDRNNNLAYFSQAGGGLLVVNASKIYSLEFDAV